MPISLRLLPVVLSMLVLGAPMVADAAQKKPEVKLAHLAVLVDDVEKTSKFLTEVVGWRRHPLRFGTGSPTADSKGQSHIDANGLWLELVSPTSAGPARDALREKGNGGYGGLIFQPKNYTGMLDKMRTEGIALQSTDGGPLDTTSGRINQWLKIDGRDEFRELRVAYWPKAVTRGTAVEMFEYRADHPDDVFTTRDRMWQAAAVTPTGPRVDRIAIIVRDIEKTARFYTHVLGLRRHLETFKLDAGSNHRSGGMRVSFIDAGGVWLALVQPVGPGPLMEYLERKGDGFVAELIVEVDDLAAYYDQMKAMGIQMVDTSGNPLDDREKAHVLVPFGDRIAYFPTDVSQGMVIEVSQRGPRETSLIHRRDRGWTR